MPLRHHAGRLLTAGLALLATLGASPARAELHMAARASSPAAIGFPHPAPVVYALELTAVGRDESFALTFESPFFGHDATGTAPAGASLQYGGERPRIDGPAWLPGPAAFSFGKLACGPSVASHGYDVQRARWDVVVPAGTTSTLSFEFTPAAASPWPDTDYDVTFEALPDLVGGGRGTLAAVQRATAAGPRPTGRRGIRVTLRSTPRTVLAGLDGAARVREGRRIAIRGTLLPRLAHAKVMLFTSTRASPAFRRAHTVRTGRNGRFRASLRARRGLQVMARVPRQRAGYSSDYSCPLGFDVRGH